MLRWESCVLDLLQVPVPTSKSSKLLNGRANVLSVEKERKKKCMSLLPDKRAGIWDTQFRRLREGNVDDQPEG